MKTKKKFLALFLALMMVLAIPVQAFGAETASIKLNTTALTLTIGKNVYLKATVKGASKKVTWRSSNTSIAAVSSTGKVVPKKIGRAAIYAKANGKTARCVVTVKKAPDYVKQAEYSKVNKAPRPGYMGASDEVSIQKFNNGWIKFVAAHYGVNGSPIYVTNIIAAKVVNNRASFSWKDSWDNAGTGTLTFGKYSVTLRMKMTKVNSFNRWGWQESITLPYKKSLTNSQMKDVYKFSESLV